VIISLQKTITSVVINVFRAPDRACSRPEATMTTLDSADAVSPAEDALFSVRLIDRRTVMPLRSGGRPVIIFTRSPRETAAEALEGRDPAVWAVRVERLATRTVAGA
jgi:hypothetical protein